MRTFASLLAIEGGCLPLLPHASSTALFAILAALIILCMGGGLGTMPSTAGEFFGVSRAGGIYGLMLIAWSIGGIVGPLVVNALIGPNKNYTAGFTTVGIIALLAIMRIPDEAAVHATRGQGWPDVIRTRRSATRAALSSRTSRPTAPPSRQPKPVWAASPASEATPNPSHRRRAVRGGHIVG